MREYLLLLPILFIFHDMEEIIGFGWFFRNNPELFERFPKITKAYQGFHTAGMALAVYEDCCAYRDTKYLVFSLTTVMLIAGAILLMMANLKFAHWLMHRFGSRL